MPTIIVDDRFTSGTNLAGRTPDTVNTPGNTWGNATGTWSISGGKASCSAVSSSKCLGTYDTEHDASTQPIELQSTFNMGGVSGSGNLGVGFTCFYVDSTHFYSVGVYNNPYPIRGIYIVRWHPSDPGGSIIKASTSFTYGVSDNITLRIVIDGNTMTAYDDANGISCTYTQTDYTSNVHGIFAGHTGATADNFTATIDLANIVLTSPQAYHTFGGRLETDAVPMVGELTGGDAPEGNLISSTYSQIGPIGSTEWSIPGVPRGQGTLTVRGKTDNSLAETVAYVGRGLRVLLLGNSQCQGQAVNNQAAVLSTEYPDLRAVMYTKNYERALLADPVSANQSGSGDAILDGASAGGSVWPRVAGPLMDLGVPFAFLPCGDPGTSLSDWAVPTDMFDRTTRIGASNYRARAYGGVDFITMQFVETEAISGRTKAATKALLVPIIEALYEHHQAPIVFIGSSQITDGAYGISTAQWNTSTEAFEEVQAEYPDIVWAMANLRSMPPPTSVDGLHWKSDAEVAAAAALIWPSLYTVAEQLLPTSGGGGGGTTVVRRGGGWAGGFNG